MEEEEEEKLLCSDCETQLGMENWTSYDPLEVEGERRARGVTLCQVCRQGLADAWRYEFSPESE